MNKNTLKKLRNEIVLNSLFVNDYKNTFNIKPITVCNFFTGYIEYLYELAEMKNFKSDDILDIINKFDNKNNLWNYYNMFADDPLKNDSTYKGIKDNEKK